MKKLYLFIFAFLCSLVAFYGIKINATSEITINFNEGAQVRTAGDKQGIKFSASID